MSASFKINIMAFKNLASKLEDSSIKSAIKDVMKTKAVAAIIAQSIADNFEQEGPGWPPLKIRKGKPLQKTGLLKKSATTPGAPGNIYNIKGTTIEWGTNLSYASLQNNGGMVIAKNSKFLFIPLTKKAERIGPQKGKKNQKKSGLNVGVDMIFKKSVMVPARPFLTIRAIWQKRLFGYVMSQCNSFIIDRITRK